MNPITAVQAVLIVLGLAALALSKSKFAGFAALVVCCAIAFGLEQTALAQG